MRIAEVEEPEAALDRVLIKVAATSVNRPDIVQRQGHYPPPPGESEILGLEVAGVVEALGPQARGFEVGDRVMALVAGGGYAEYATAAAGHVIRMPETMSFVQAACICETYITAYLNLFIGASLADGETVLLHGGGGGVNTAAVQLTRALTPAATVIVTASAGKLERVRALGAHLVIDYRAQDFAEAVRAYGDKHGADVILDHIGGPYLARNLKTLATGGRLVIIGVMGGAKAELNLATLMVKRQHVIGSVLRSRPPAEKSAIIARFSQTVVPLFVAGSIAPIIDRVLPIEQVVEAHRAMEAGEHFGKIVLTLQPRV
jgi:putative PIG3 family NAD(P)H quinone oxidoreductase